MYISKRKIKQTKFLLTEEFLIFFEIVTKIDTCKNNKENK